MEALSADDGITCPISVRIPALSPKKLAQYPEPSVVPALEEHIQTFIVLHGRGSNANGFGPALLAHPIPGHISLRHAFPKAKFIFPTASKRRAARFNRATINQWFDNAELGETMRDEEQQAEGLHDTSVFIHGLLREAISEVGADNVILGGLSQGCAAALIAILTWGGEPIRAVFGMCGWLPFAGSMEEEMATDRDYGYLGNDEDDPFDRSEDISSKTPVSASERALSIPYEVLDLGSSANNAASFKTPLFIGHGALDEKVTVVLGRQAARCMTTLGVKTEYKEYPDLAHWYSGDMLADLVVFFREHSK